jgi:hypothetical protein
MPQQTHGESLPQEVFEALADDAAVLQRAGRRLAWLAWSWFLLFGLNLLVTLALIAVGRLGALPFTVAIGIVLLGVSLFYFWLARYVSRGRRWAIAVALFLVSVFATLLIMRIFTPRPMGLAAALFDTFFLLATLNLLKVLFQGWAAARRIRHHLNPPAETQGLEWEGSR